MTEGVGAGRADVWRPAARFDRARARLTRAGSAPLDERGAAVLLATVVVLLGVLSIVVGATVIPPVVQVLPLLAAGLVLRRRRMVLLIALVVAFFAADLAVLGVPDVRAGSIVIVVLVIAFSLELSRSRERVGVTGLRGEMMLMELRQRLDDQGRVPALPAGWNVEVELRAAGGAAFAGDFLVSALTGEQQMEIALVDVTGKGLGAGTRALLLSGALGGLLGAVPPEGFLAAANDYLFRQGWDEGFATAVHVVIDLAAGEYVVQSAGHPPAAHFDAGSGRWGLSAASGVVLGVLPDLTYQRHAGTLRAGDALLLYTDGLVEVPGRDLAVGIDKLLGEAERLVPRGFAASAQGLVDSVAPDASDDRALVLLWRS